MSIYGNIIDGDQVEQAVLNMLKAPSPYGGTDPHGNERSTLGRFLDIIAEQRGREHGTWEEPKSWEPVSEFDKWPEHPLPCVLVISPGIVPGTTRKHRGVYTATWEVIVAVIVSANKYTATRRLGMRYGAAIRAAMLKNPKLPEPLEGKAAVKEWETEGYADLPFEESRNMHVVRNVFYVDVEDVVTFGAVDWPSPDEMPDVPSDPDDPDSPPASPDWPTADHVYVEGARDITDEAMQNPDVVHEIDDTAEEAP